MSGAPEPAGRAAPAVSVILPTYDRGALLRRAVDSVLAQTFGDLELIVVDDGSTDGSVEALSAVKDPRLVVLRHDANRGAAAARNTGLRAARGHLLAFQDSDDEWLPDHLESLIGVLEDAGPSCALAYGDQLRVEGGRTYYFPAPDVARGRLVDPGTGDYQVRNMGLPAVVVRKRAVEEVGGFDERLRRLIDFDLFVRLALRHDFVHLRRPVVRYHESEGISTNASALAEGRMALLRKYEAELAREPRHLAFQRWRVGTAMHTADRHAEARRWFRAAVAAYPWDARFAGAMVLSHLGRRAYDPVARAAQARQAAGRLQPIEQSPWRHLAEGRDETGVSVPAD